MMAPDTIFAEASARLAGASPGAETLAIGIEFFEATGAHLAGSVFLGTATRGLSDPETNAVILTTLDDLLRIVSDSLAAFGVTEGAYRDQCLEAAERGFLDRGEALFTTAGAGGRA